MSVFAFSVNLSSTLPSIDVQSDPILKRLHAESSFWSGYKNYFRCKDLLYHKVVDISKGQKLPDGWAETIVKGITSTEYPYLKTALRIIWMRLPQEERKAYVEKLVQESTSSSNLEMIHRWLNLVTDKELEVFLTALGKFSDQLGILLMAECEKDSRELLLTTIATVESPYLIRVLCKLINTILMAFSFFELGREPGSTWEASHFLNVYLGLPTGLLVAFSHVFTTAGMVFFATAATIAALIIVATIYARKLRILPKDCHSLAEEIRRNKSPLALGRESELQKLIVELTSQSDVKSKSPLLCGQAGVGKLHLVRLLAQKIHRGDKDLPDNLKNKEIIHINMGKLLSSSPFEAKDKLERLLERTLNDKNVILFFDEFAAVFEPQYKEIATRLGSVFDTSGDRLQFCIAAMTKEEQEKYVEGNKTWKRRFEPIVLSSMTKEETITILGEILKRDYSDVEISVKELEEIYDKTAKEGQPNETVCEVSNEATRRRMQLKDEHKKAYEEALYKQKMLRINHRNYEETRKETGARLETLAKELPQLKAAYEDEQKKVVDRKQYAYRKKVDSHVFSLAYAHQYENKPNEKAIQFFKSYVLK